MCARETPDGPDVSRYVGRWVALLNGQVIGVGDSRREAYQAGRNSRPREEPTSVVYVRDDGSPDGVASHDLAALFGPGTLAGRVREWMLEVAEGAYLVGGSVRDFLAGRSGHDLDLAVDGNALDLGRSLADRLAGAYYPVDPARGVARIVLREDAACAPTQIDIATLRDGSIEQDLAGRDFTINAMAVNLITLDLLDPHGGQEDLNRQRLRLVSPRGIEQDPVRALRGVRQAGELALTLDPDTADIIQRDGNRLVDVSAERIRDEYVYILSLPDSAGALGRAERLGLLRWTIPELAGLRDVRQAAPHQLDVWEHSLLAVTRLEALLRWLLTGRAAGYDQDGLPASLWSFRESLARHLGSLLAGQRPRWLSLKLAALLHDVAKPACRQVDETGRVRFLGHEQQGAEVASAVAQRLRFSRAEVEMIGVVVRYHMRPLLLSQGRGVTRRAAHRFYRDAGDAGLDVALLALADHQALKPGPALLAGSEPLAAVVDSLVRYRLGPDAPEMVIPLITGRDLIDRCRIEPGPAVGRWLRRVREEQVCGVLHSREDAVRWVTAKLEKERQTPCD
jgi:poly(A) polymerase